MGKLIIVESPSKAKTISTYVDKDVLVLSSKGHVRDLAKSGRGGLGIDFDNEYMPSYVIIPEKEKIVDELIKKSKDKEVLIATDPDREGEAIGWHLAELLELDQNKNNRIVFNEITKQAITEALKKPRKIDQNLVFSQETRRILDRIIGFRLSTLLQAKIKSKSAGRVQSVALKLVCELEKKIEEFIPVTYYELEANFKNFKADYIIKANTRLTKEEALTIKENSKNPFIVKDIIKKQTKKQPKIALITASLQREASYMINMSPEKTMVNAQSLYEGIKVNGEIIGLITYMRTDSSRLSMDFVNKTKAYIKDNYGEEYVGIYRTAKTENTQDAHEAIRPTSITRTPEKMEEYLTKDQFKLYKYIYDRTLSSLMAPAVCNTTKVVLETNDLIYEANGKERTFLGFETLFEEEKNKDTFLPNLNIGDNVLANDIKMLEKVTQPPARYTEATLIRDLEKQGIGRPSTYVAIIKTLKARDYVKLEKKQFHLTDQGRLTSEQLNLFFKKIINVKYTSLMEKDLDDVALGLKKGNEIIDEFYHNFTPLLENAQKNMAKIEPKQTGEFCPLCGKPLVVRTSKYGDFIGCSGFPKCKYIKKEEDDKQID